MYIHIYKVPYGSNFRGTGRWRQTGLAACRPKCRIKRFMKTFEPF